MWENIWIYLLCFIIILCFPDDKRELGLSVVVIRLALDFMWAMVEMDRWTDYQNMPSNARQTSAEVRNGPMRVLPRYAGKWTSTVDKGYVWEYSEERCIANEISKPFNIRPYQERDP